MREHDPVFLDWVARAKAGSFEQAVQLCGFVPAKGMGKGKDHAGPCPACGGRDRFSVHYGKRKFNCRHCGARGCDALALALVGERVSFVEACEALSGEARPARVGAETQEQKAARLARRARMEADAAAAAKARAAEADKYRAEEQERARAIWAQGQKPSPARLGLYCAARGITLPASALIREVENLPYHHGFEVDERGYKCPVTLTHAPAMLAAMLDNENKVVGVHITYLRPDWAGKLEIFDPETGEKLPAKKMRGSKKGCHIVVRQPPLEPAMCARLFLAEGIETVASVACALQKTNTLWPGDVFWAAADLGNLGGPAMGRMNHPTLKTDKGRAQTVPDAVPDLEAPAIRIPPHIRHLVLLGDGDSEPVLTQTTLERGRARYAAQRAAMRAEDADLPPLSIALAFAPQGRDFNDVLRAA